jgi:hypothetical protein
MEELQGRVADSLAEEGDGARGKRKQKLATRRRRRHHAAAQQEAVPEVVLDERRVEGERGRRGEGEGEEGGRGREEGEPTAGRRREKRGGRKTRPEPLAGPSPYLSTGPPPPPESGTGGLDDPTHIATTHEDTTSGAVHCFRDEYGNWQTYTFGSDTPASSTVGAAASSSRALAGLINRSGAGGRTAGGAAGGGSPVGSSRSSASADSGLTVILDSPAMVFQPGARSQEGSQGRGREARPDYWAR